MARYHHAAQRVSAVYGLRAARWMSAKSFVCLKLELCLVQVLANDAPGRAAFVHSGGLQKLQEMAEQPGSRLKEAVAVINSSYPEEIVKYYSPTYSAQLLQKLDAMAAEAIST